MKKIKPIDVVFNAGLAALISIPIIVAKFMSAGKEAETETVHRATSAFKEAEAETKEQAQFGDVYSYSFVSKIEETEPEAELETEAPTEAPGFKGYDSIPLDMDFQEAIFNLCEENQISFELILAVIKTESRFHVDSIGDGGNSIGLMQIQPRWWQGLADANGLNIYEPIDNVHLGIIILNNMINKNGGDLGKALKQYNSGNPNNPSNAYVERVFENYSSITEGK